MSNFLFFIFFARRIMFIAFDHAFFTAHAHEKFNFDGKKVKTHIGTLRYAGR